MPDSRKMVVIVAPDGRVLSFNTECERVTGFSQREVIGKKLMDLLVPATWKDTVSERFRKATQQNLGEPHLNPWLTKDGGERMIEWCCSFIPDKDGKSIVGFGRPVDEQPGRNVAASNKELIKRQMG
jgi:PAS domain S-box-containing protein